MISANTSTAFKLEKFQVTNFSFNLPNFESNEFSIKFEPSGIYHESKGIYDLIIEFSAVDEINTDFEIIKLKSVSNFIFEKNVSFENIPDHFFSNSIPIVFPFLRAFVSTLTLQANVDVMMIGLINFTNLKEPLFNSTQIIKD